ncbi:MAG: DUF4476 domain-containing protein [Ichthyobacteriaceae bacterium]|nr:DUF4476 domain-containing protein [Ichthyobacteriaceae bacterium]
MYYKLAPAILLFISFFAFKTNAQSNLVVFSEQNETFLLGVDNVNCNTVNKNNIEVADINKKKITVNVELKNGTEINKKIELPNNSKYVLAIVKDGYSYSLKYRGTYGKSEKTPVFVKNNRILSVVAFKNNVKRSNHKKKKQDNKTVYPIKTKQKPIVYTNSKNNTSNNNNSISNSKLISLNNLIPKLKTKRSEAVKCGIIITELQKGNFNCRQLNYVYTFLDSDKLKLDIIKKVKNNISDKNNVNFLLTSFASDESKYVFWNIVKDLSKE